MKTPNNPFGIHRTDFFPEDMEFAETYECVFCKIVSPDNLCLKCNHCICKSCISKGKKYEECPIDGAEIIEGIKSFNNILLGKALLDKLKIRCIFYNDGCRWSGLFKDFEKGHLPKCDYKRDSNENLNIKVDEEYSIEDNIKYESNSSNSSNSINESNNRKLCYNENDKDNNDESIYELIFADNELDYQINNFLLNKKRKNLKEIENENNDKENNIYELNENQNFIDINSHQSYNSNKNNENSYVLLPEESSDENNSNDIKYENSSLNENTEKMNNIIKIDSNLTCNIYPYYYYFTEPLSYSFTCLIKTISRNYLRDNKEISFGLRNIDNEEFLEILTTKKQENLFFKGDKIRISYDNDLFVIYFENDKKNYISIPFKNNKQIKYFPAIILNDKDDILEVSHN